MQYYYCRWCKNNNFFWSQLLFSVKLYYKKFEKHQYDIPDLVSENDLYQCWKSSRYLADFQSIGILWWLQYHWCTWVTSGTFKWAIAQSTQWARDVEVFCDTSEVCWKSFNGFHVCFLTKHNQIEFLRQVVNEVIFLLHDGLSFRTYHQPINNYCHMFWVTFYVGRWQES